MNGSKDARYSSETLQTSMDLKVQVAGYNSDVPVAKFARYASDTRSS